MQPHTPESPRRAEGALAWPSCGCRVCEERGDALRMKALMQPLPQQNEAQRRSQLLFWAHAVQLVLQSQLSVRRRPLAEALGSPVCLPDVLVGMACA